MSPGGGVACADDGARRWGPGPAPRAAAAALALACAAAGACSPGVEASAASEGTAELGVAGAGTPDVRSDAPPAFSARAASDAGCRLPPDLPGRLDTLAVESGGDEPVRVILLIGDGVGVGYWTAARLRRPELAAFRMPVVGFTDSRNARGRVTDSAASATAMATGCLTYNGAIGMGPDTTALLGVAQVARRRGLATGLVTTSRVTHATPAAFAAHVVDRGSEEQIAAQMVDARPDVLMGGGRRWFRAEGRRDGQDLLSRLRQGAAYVETPAALDSVAARWAADGPARLVGLFAEGDLRPAPEREASLPAMARAALAVLDRDPDGFFLVVEAAQPDWRGHDAQRLAAVQEEMLTFDDAVRAARAYRARRPGTLVLVAADHETGGLAVAQAGDRLVERWATGGSGSVRDHTANLVPHFAAGPGAEALRGIQTPASIGRHLLATVGGDGLARALEAMEAREQRVASPPTGGR